MNNLDGCLSGPLGSGLRYWLSLCTRYATYCVLEQKGADTCRESDSAQGLVPTLHESLMCMHTMEATKHANYYIGLALPRSAEIPIH